MRQFFPSLNFRPYSSEIDKLSDIYNNNDSSNNDDKICLKGSQIKSSKSCLKFGRFSLLQTLLISYALVAILRFFTIAYLQTLQNTQALEAYYQLDLLMSMVNFRRNLNKYVHLCFAAFAGFTVYTHYLNYYGLNWTVVGLLQSYLKAKIKANSEFDSVSVSRGSSIEKKVNSSSSMCSSFDKGETRVKCRTRWTKKAKSGGGGCFTELFVRAECPVFLVLYFLFSLTLFSRVRQYYRISKLFSLTTRQTIWLEVDGACMMLLNGSLLKLAIFEETTVWLLCDLLAAKYARNSAFFSKCGSANRRLHRFVDLLGHLAAHFRANLLVAELNKAKVSKSILAFIVFFGPINIYLLSNLLQANLQALWVNLIVTALLQTIILTTSTIPMVRISRAIRGPAKYLNAHQLALPVTPSTLYGRHKLKMLAFVEYVDSGRSGGGGAGTGDGLGALQGFSIGTNGTVNSINLLKFVLIYFGYIMNATLLRASNSSNKNYEDY